MDAAAGITNPFLPLGKTSSLAPNENVYGYSFVQNALSQIPKDMQLKLPQRQDFTRQECRDTLVPKLLQAAARSGTQAVLELFKGDGSLFNQPVCAAAAEGGHLETLQWLREQGAIWDLKTCEQAACKGHQHILSWLLETDAPFQWSTVCRSAASQGHFSIIRWAINDFKVTIDSEWYRAAAFRGCLETLSYLWPLSQEKINDLHHHAIAGGKLHVLKWLEEQHYEMHWRFITVNCLDSAALSQSWVTIKWALDRGCPPSQMFWYQVGLHQPTSLKAWIKEQESLSPYYFMGLAERGDLAQLQSELHPYMKQLTPERKAFLILGAVKDSNRQVFNWIKSQKWKIAEWNSGMIANFISDAQKSMHTLAWGFRNGLGKEYFTLVGIVAAFEGQLDPLVWAYKQHALANKPPRTKKTKTTLHPQDPPAPMFNHKVCEGAARHGNLKILQWLQKRGCPWSPLTAELLAYDHFPALKWVIEQGCPWGTLTVGKLTEKGHLSTAKWASDNGCPQGVVYAVELMRSGRLITLKFIYKNGSSTDLTTLAKIALAENQLDLAGWAIEKGASFTAQELQNYNPRWVEKYRPYLK